MLFNSLQYLIFFPAVVFLYFVLPYRARQLWLLFASYYFYMCWNVQHAVLMLFSTFITYVCGLLLEKAGKISVKKAILVSCILLNMGILFYFKYSNFAMKSLQQMLNIVRIELKVPVFDVMLPVGISFFTFQAVGYVADVYRGESRTEKNFFRYALFVSFFPQLVAGPIERSGNLLLQLEKPALFDLQKAAYGLLAIAYGLFLKMVVADNIAAVIDPVFAEPAGYAGMELLTASILFAFQIYADFEGYTKLAIGSAAVLGYRLNENFNMPYLAVSVKDFWRRWHISLTSWLRDYIYKPLGGGKTGTVRKQLNTMIVFICSGLWHGAAWHYVVWGALNGAMSIIEDLSRPAWNRLKGRLKIKEDRIAYRICCRLATFIAIDVTWIFFRAGSLRAGADIFHSVALDFRLEWFLAGGYAGMFDSIGRFAVIFLSLIVLGVADMAKYAGKDISKMVFRQQAVFRWIFYWIILMVILYWGIYGTGYVQTQFIYFQF